jgi:hypothetical protein
MVGERWRPRLYRGADLDDGLDGRAAIQAGATVRGTPSPHHSRCQARRVRPVPISIAVLLSLSRTMQRHRAALGVAPLTVSPSPGSRLGRLVVREVVPRSWRARSTPIARIGERNRCREGGANSPPRVQKRWPLQRRQSLNGSNSLAPAIATANGRSVCSTLIDPAWCASTSGSRR